MKICNRREKFFQGLEKYYIFHLFSSPLPFPKMPPRLSKINFRNKLYFKEFRVFFPIFGKVALIVHWIIISLNAVKFTVALIFLRIFGGLLILQIIIFPPFALQNSLVGNRVRITGIRESRLCLLSRSLSIGRL